MKFLFFPQSCLPFHGMSLEERPLGGTETGVIRLAEELHQLGHEVIVLSGHENPPLTAPLYLPLHAIDNLGKIDVLVSVRDWTPLLAPLNARVKLYWTGDSYDQFPNVGIGDTRVAQEIDALLAVSDWHADRLCEESGFPRERAWVIRNGIRLSFFEGEEERKRKRMIYSSTPYRGLRFIPMIYRELKNRHPEAEIHIFSGYEVYAGGEAPPAHLLKEYEVLRQEFLRLPHCFLHGNLKQRDLAREFMKSSLLLYPNIFEETSCITALEAQAAGCAIVTSALAALPETVGDAGLLITGTPGSLEYLNAFIGAADRILADDELFQQLSRNGRERAKETDWRSVAERLLRFLGEYAGGAR